MGEDRSGYGLNRVRFCHVIIEDSGLGVAPSSSTTFDPFSRRGLRAKGRDLALLFANRS